MVDDNSEDGTGDEIKNTRDTKTELLYGRPLPKGWTGKLWALQQGIDEISQRERSPTFLLFSDADIIHPKESVRQLVLHAENSALELVSLMVRLNCRSKWEIILIPAFVFFFQKLYPFPWINNPSSRTAGAAGGCILIRTATLMQAGGLEKIKNQVIDDCALAKLIKPHGPVWIGLTQEVLSHRIYPSLIDIWNMVIRTAFDQLHHSDLSASSLIHWHDYHLRHPAGCFCNRGRKFKFSLNGDWGSYVGDHDSMLSADAKIICPQSN